MIRVEYKIKPKKERLKRQRSDRELETLGKQYTCQYKRREVKEDQN